MVGTPDDSLAVQKQAFRALRADKSNQKISLAIYQESDGHQETIRLVTPEQLAKHEKQAAADTAEVKKFDAAQKGADNKTPETKKQEAEFKARAAAAEKEESKK